MPSFSTPFNFVLLLVILLVFPSLQSTSAQRNASSTARPPILFSSARPSTPTSGPRGFSSSSSVRNNRTVLSTTSSSSSSTRTNRTVPFVTSSSSSSSSAGESSTGIVINTAEPPPGYTLPVVTSTRGCNDDSCPSCPVTQQCHGADQLTLVGRNFCQRANVNLVIHQYSSVAACTNFRLIGDRNSQTTAVCTVPPMPNSAWVAPAQVYVQLQCVGEDMSELYPALTYSASQPACGDCDDHELDRTKKSSLWWVGVLLGVGTAVVAVCAMLYWYCRRRSQRLAGASGSDELLSEVALPMPIYAPMVEHHAIGDAYSQQQLPHSYASAPYVAPSYIPRPHSQRRHGSYGQTSQF